MFDQNLQEALHKATTYTRKCKNEFVSLEHFLWGALHVNAVVYFLESFDINLPEVIFDLEEYVNKNHPTLKRIGSNYNPEPTLGLHRSIDRALKQAQSSGKNTISVFHIFISMFDEDESFALASIEQMGLSPLILMEHLSEEGHNQQSDAASSGKDPLKQFCENLNTKFQKGDLPNLIGRKKELERILEILSRKTKNNPLLVGDPGVGKTALGESLAELIEEEKAPEKFKDMTVFSLDLTALLAGSKYRGDFEARMKGLFKSLKEITNPLLFIDEVHSIVGAGSTSGSSVDVAGLLKPSLTDPHIKVIGSTTYSEYRKHFAKDPALSRRFQPIFIEEPSKEETLEILTGTKKEYEAFHGVKIETEALRATVDFASLHILDRKFPDKAFDLLDETCAHESTIQNNNNISEKEISKTLSRVYKVSENSTERKSESLVTGLKTSLAKKIFGQDEAIEELYSNIVVSYSGLGPKNKPLGCFLFTGPTGVGKTEVSKQLAEHLNRPLIKLDMSEYMEKHSVAKLIGAPPGYVGHDDGGRLTDAVSKSPRCVLLLDEIEKAHPDVINVLLQVMDSGVLTDSIGKTTHFTQCTIIMTSNSGARQAEKGSLGFFEASSHDFSDKAIKEFFSPEFLNRLTSIVKFKPLSEKSLSFVVVKNLEILRTELIDKNVAFEWSKAVVDWITKDGAEKGMGARPFERFIAKQIRLPIAKKLISKSNNASLTLKIDFKDSKLVISES